MKRMLLVAMAVGLFGAMPVMAAEHGKMKMDHGEGVRQCAVQAESIQEKIERLKAEVAKGEKKYSAAQLKKLEQKLKEANKLLDALTTGP